MKNLHLRPLKYAEAGALVVAMLLIGSCAPRASRQILPSNRPDATRPAMSEPADRETIRIAQPEDLQATLMTPANSSDHFPKATVKVYNTASHDVIVGYEPGCVVVHCGAFEQHAPGMTFTRRREILRSRQPLEFEMSTGGWMRSPGPGEQDLLIPLSLPPGKYSVWATFKVSGSDRTIESQHDTYVVP